MPSDNPSVGVRYPRSPWGLALGAALALALWPSHARATYASPATGPVCGQKVVTSPDGTSIRVLFANNGFVQQYIVLANADNPEAVNDARKSLESTYGPAQVNAPPLKIISYRPAPGGGGMMVPDKAIDSCGRTLDFN